MITYKDAIRKFSSIFHNPKYHNTSEIEDTFIRKNKQEYIFVVTGEHKIHQTLGIISMYRCTTRLKWSEDVGLA